MQQWRSCHPWQIYCKRCEQTSHVYRIFWLCFIFFVRERMDNGVSSNFSSCKSLWANMRIVRVFLLLLNSRQIFLFVCLYSLAAPTFHNNITIFSVAHREISKNRHCYLCCAARPFKLTVYQIKWNKNHSVRFQNFRLKSSSRYTWLGTIVGVLWKKHGILEM